LIDCRTWGYGKLGSDEKYGKRRQVTFRIGHIAEDRLARAAALFNLKPSEYAKALLYKDLGVFDEPLDQRRKSWLRQKKRLAREEEDDSGLLVETEPDEDGR
jgi:hypothetical protein